MKIDIKDILKGRVVIVGIGNIMRGDDAFGPVLIESIQGKVTAVCIDAGTAPENYLGKIAKERPETVLLADAVHLDKKPGIYEILKKSDILNHGLTTHNISPNVLIEFLERETEADIYLLGIQPKSTSFGDDMCDEVKRSISEISEYIKETINA